MTTTTKVRLIPDEVDRARKMARDCGLSFRFVCENMVRSKLGVPEREPRDSDRVAYDPEWEPKP